MPGLRYCAVNSCKTNSKNKDKSVQLFKFPSTFTENWRRVVNKGDWTPKTNSRICSLHFARDDIIRNTLRDGALPIPDCLNHVQTG